MFKTVLVPLDGSKRAEAILPHVEDLGRCNAARSIFLRVVEPVTVLMGPEGATPILSMQVIDEQRAQAESYVTRLRDDFRSKGLSADARVVFGPVVSAILQIAEEEGADLIAMASHGRGGLARVFYGSVAAGILQRVDRPLLLVRSAVND